METRRRGTSGTTAIFFRNTVVYTMMYIYIYISKSLTASISGTSLQKHRPYLGSRPPSKPNKRVEQGATGSAEIGLACVLCPHVARVDRDGKEIGRRLENAFQNIREPPIFHRPVESLGNLAPNPPPLFSQFSWEKSWGV